MEKVLAIVGPTAVGKTALSIELAQRFNGEIISGDSLQVYRKLDIGTAKVTPEEAQGVPHHLIDIRELDEGYSVAEFQKMGRQLISEITAKGKLPLVVGGTGLYIQALLQDFTLGGKQEPGVDLAAENIRQRYETYADTNGNQALWDILKQKDALAAAHIHFNNRRKVIRALEVWEGTGSSILQPQVPPKPLYDTFLVGLNTERSLLYQRINQRVELMWQAGLLAEAELLREQEDSQAAKGIGYREFFPYFKGEQSLEEVKEQIKQDSRRYAKRQLTWFRNRMTPYWVDLVQEPETVTKLEMAIREWLEANNS